MPDIKLDTPIQYLKGVGPTMATRLEKLAIHTVGDLLYHFPHRHEDLSLTSKIANIQAGETVTIQGTIVSAKNVFTKRGLKMQQAVIADGSGQLQATWFNQPYLITLLRKAETISLSGKVDWFGSQLVMTAPEYELLKPNANGESPMTIHTGRLVPTYPETYGISSKWLRSRIASLLSAINDQIIDWLPDTISQPERLIDLKTATHAIHFPTNLEQLESAKSRLAFDELFLLQLASQYRKRLWTTKKLSHPLNIDQEKITQYLAQLPFTLTAAQNRSLREILTDLSQIQPMNRLLQGDVGSGKTVVAAAAIYVCYTNGLKSILMAPTEILANQHYQTLKALLEPFGLKIKLVTGATKSKAKNNPLEADVLVGTHALLFQDIPQEVGLLVVDEQHRFGVEQRAKLLQSPKTPHLLSMTATPIPRTVALTIYGELDLSTIDEMPVGRKPVKTWVVPHEKRFQAYEWIRTHIVKTHSQAFIVCPLINESEADSLTEVKAVQKEYETLSQTIFPNLKLGLLHGRLKSKEKDGVLAEFKSGKLNILVSTPVIEVGIDIPNASVMMIEGSERFGLAQLHQLRGRVGRGEAQSYCLIFTTTKDQINLSRLKAMETNHSGFALAEIDLSLRGPGEMYGLKQSGFMRLKLASFSDANLIKTTHAHAKQLIEADPNLIHHPTLKQKLESLLPTAQIEPN